jgi:hypothetical protein
MDRLIQFFSLELGLKINVKRGEFFITDIADEKFKFLKCFELILLKRGF